jgi:hypothetical protein
MGHGQLIQGLVNGTAWHQALLLQPMFSFLSQHLFYYFFLNIIRINFLQLLTLYFHYTFSLLVQPNITYIKIFVGGGG